METQKFRVGQFWIFRNPSTGLETLVKIVRLRTATEDFPFTCLVSLVSPEGWENQIWVESRNLIPCEHSDLLEELDSIGSL